MIVPTARQPTLWMNKINVKRFEFTHGVLWLLNICQCDEVEVKLGFGCVCLHGYTRLVSDWLQAQGSLIQENLSSLFGYLFFHLQATNLENAYIH